MRVDGTLAPLPAAVKRLLGVIEPGAFADLDLVEGDPVRCTRTVGRDLYRSAGNNSRTQQPKREAT